MTGEDFHIIAERPEFFADAVEQERMIAAGQIRAPDAPGEKNVAAKQQALVLLKKTKAAGAMAGL